MSKPKRARAGVRAKVPTGRVPGIPVPSTEKSAAASRTNALKHGEYARAVTGQEGRRALSERKFPGLGEVLDAHVGAIVGGNPEAMEGLAVVAMTQSELLRRAMVKEVFETGVLVKDDIIGVVDGKAAVIGHRHKANPVLEPLRHFTEITGNTAEQHQLTRKSRGEGAVNAALAFRHARDAQLRALERPQRALPPPSDGVLDVEIVK